MNEAAEAAAVPHRGCGGCGCVPRALLGRAETMATGESVVVV